MSWNIDTSHSQIQFSVRHMMISTVRGHFTDVSAQVEIDPAHLERSTVTAQAKVASLSTGDAQRDGHLKSADFFDAENHPEISLIATKVSVTGHAATVDVAMTIRDVTRTVTLKGEVMGPAKDPWGNQRVGWSLTGELDREEFGLTWNQALETGGVLVGKKVKVELEAQFVHKAD